MKAYVASPLHADTAWEIKVNMTACAIYKKHVSEEAGKLGIAVHDKLPEILNDNIPEHRFAAKRVGEMFIDVADILYCCGEKLTKGMQVEAQYALANHKPVICFSIAMRDSLHKAGLQCIFFFDPILGTDPITVVLDSLYERQFNWTDEDRNLLHEGGMSLFKRYHGCHTKEIRSWFT